MNCFEVLMFLAVTVKLEPFRYVLHIQWFVNQKCLWYEWNHNKKYVIVFFFCGMAEAGLYILHAWWWACMEHAHQEVFACMKSFGHKSIKTTLSSTSMLFKVVSYFCIWKQKISWTIRFDIHNLFQLRSCC